MEERCQLRVLSLPSVLPGMTFYTVTMQHTASAPYQFLLGIKLSVKRAFHHSNYHIMCTVTKTVYRCGNHSANRYAYCGRNGRKLCDNVVRVDSNQTYQTCPTTNCRFEVLRGCWQCCVCRNGPNRTGKRVFVSCRHEVCFRCLTYSPP